MSDEAGTWVEFADAPKQRAFLRVMRTVLPIMVLVGTASVFFSRSGESPFRTWGVVAVPVWFVFWSTVAAITWNVVLRLSRPFAVDVAGRRLRIRGRVLTFEQVDSAELVPLSNDDASGLLLKFGQRKGRKASVLLRDRAEPVLDDERRDLLLAVVRGSTIARPVSPHDPTGAFGQFNFPGTLDREGAEQVVLQPPAPGEHAP
jgi:hypothetical protein